MRQAQKALVIEVRERDQAKYAEQSVEDAAASVIQTRPVAKHSQNADSTGNDMEQVDYQVELVKGPGTFAQRWRGKQAEQT